MSTPVQCESARMPVRKVLAALVLTMFGLWQGWQCADGMSMATPGSGVVTMTHTIGQVDMASTVADVAERQMPGMPGGLIAACVTVLVGMLATLLLLIIPERLPIRLRAVLAAVDGHVRTLVRAPALAQLCVSRT